MASKRTSTTTTTIDANGGVLALSVIEEDSRTYARVEVRIAGNRYDDNSGGTYAITLTPEQFVELRVALK